MFIDTDDSIPINTCKFKKNYLNIISNTSIASCSPYSENNQRFNLDVESPSLPEKDTELFYYSKIARSDIQACVA